jgi:hypothetical protein
MLFVAARRFRTSAAFRRIRNSADFLQNNRNSPRMIASAPWIHGAQSKALRIRSRCSFDRHAWRLVDRL